MSCKIDFINNWELRYQGAESRLYYGLHSNYRCVIKHRFPKKYRHPILDEKLTKERTKREKRIINKIRSNSKLLGPYMPKVVWSDDSTILMTEVLDSESVYDFLYREPAKATIIAPLIAKCLAEIHDLGIIHGDLTTSNLLLVPKEQDQQIVIPIDFGLSTGSEHPEEKAVDLYVLERALSSTFKSTALFDDIFESYIAQTKCDKEKIIERYKAVRARGRKIEL